MSTQRRLKSAIVRHHSTAYFAMAFDRPTRLSHPVCLIVRVYTIGYRDYRLLAADLPSSDGVLNSSSGYARREWIHTRVWW